MPGSEVAGTVISAPADSGLREGERVMAFTVLGGMAERAVAPAYLTFALPEQLDFAQGASVILNYHTVYFALEAARSPCKRASACSFMEPRAAWARLHCRSPRRWMPPRSRLSRATRRSAWRARPGADEVVRSDGPWREQVLELGGVDVVLDPVGGDRFTDSLRCLREDGRVLVVGFTEGSIPEVKVNRLAAAQRVGSGGRVGRLCDGQSVSQQSHRRGHRWHDRRRVH